MLRVALPGGASVTMAVTHFHHPQDAEAERARERVFVGEKIAGHFTLEPVKPTDNAITSEIEGMLLPLGARPHWGKIMHARAEQLVPVYPKLSEFRELARSYDPGGKFRNDFLDIHVFG